MKTPIPETQASLGINTLINTPQPFITPYYTITSTILNDAQETASFGSSLSSLTSLVNDIGGEDESEKTKKTSEQQKRSDEDFGASSDRQQGLQDDNEDIGAKNTDQGRRGINEDLRDDRQTITATKQQAINKVFRKTLAAGHKIIECHINHQEPFTEDPAQTLFIDQLPSFSQAKPRNKAALKQIVTTKATSKLKQKKKEAIEETTNKKIKKQKAARPTKEASVVLERLPVNTPKSRKKPTSADAATSTRGDFILPKREPGDDVVITISDDDDIKTEPADDDHEENDGDDETRPSPSTHRHQHTTTYTTFVVANQGEQTDQPAAESAQFGGHIEIQAAQSSSCSAPIDIGAQQQQQYIISSGAAAQILQLQQQPHTISNDAGTAVEQQQYAIPVTETILWQQLHHPMDPSQVPAIPQKQTAGSDASLIQQAAAASKITSLAPEAIFQPVAIPPGPNINIQQQQNVTSVSIEQAGHPPNNTNTNQHPPLQQQQYYGLPIISSHQNTSMQPPRATGSYQGQYDTLPLTHNIQQQRAAQHSILNFSTNQHHLTNAQMKTPPPAHIQQRPETYNHQLRTPTPTSGVPPPPSNHGGVIRSPTVAARPHCPWCQQVANWEQIAKALGEEWKKIKGLMDNAKYNAEKLREHGCPPPPP